MKIVFWSAGAVSMWALAMLGIIRMERDPDTNIRLALLMGAALGLALVSTKRLFDAWDKEGF